MSESAGWFYDGREAERVDKARAGEYSLRPCPWCNGTDLKMRHLAAVSCSTCGASGPSAPALDGTHYNSAAELWNACPRPEAPQVLAVAERHSPAPEAWPTPLRAAVAAWLTPSEFAPSEAAGRALVALLHSATSLPKGVRLSALGTGGWATYVEAKARRVRGARERWALKHTQGDGEGEAWALLSYRDALNHLAACALLGAVVVGSAGEAAQVLVEVAREAEREAAEAEAREAGTCAERGFHLWRPCGPWADGGFLCERCRICGQLVEGATAGEVRERLAQANEEVSRGKPE